MQKRNLTLKRGLSVVITLCVLISCFAGFGVSAASGGSGTKNDPYLLKTAKDVDNIRNDLGAYYKLAANIDMKSFGVFEPIGCFEPFTGTLTCDMGSNGLPKYAIYNLKVDNQIGAIFGYDFASANYAGYGEEGVHYYASLFGKTDGAMIQNIFLFDVNINNTVVGQHGGVGGYFDGGPQIIIMDKINDQGTAALVTFAYGTTIDGCGATGVITSRSNQTGGLVGNLTDGSSLLNSFADVTMTAEGFWHNGGLVGYVADSVVDGCMSRGTIYPPGNTPYISRGIRNPGNAASGLAGNVSSSSSVTNCYSEVVFKNNGKGLVAKGAFASCEEEEMPTIENCYATGTVEGNGGVTASDSTKNNNWVLKVSGIQQEEFDFKVGTEAEITAAFKGLDEWDTSGKLPVLKALTYINKGGEPEGDSAGSSDSKNENTVSQKEDNTSSHKNENTSSAGKNESTASGNKNEGTASKTESTSSGTANNTVNTTSDNTDSSADNTQEDTLADGNTDTAGDNTANGDTTTEETVVSGAVEEKVPVVYIVLFASIAAITVAITAFSSILLLKTYKRSQALSAEAEYEEEEE